MAKLSTVSRNFKRGISVVFTGTASVGKSELIKVVLLAVWVEAREDFTRTSENYLLYRNKPLEHMVITYYEIHGTKHAAHIIRTALSEGNLKIGTVMNHPKGGLIPVEIDKPADGLVILSTFASGSVDWELNTRIIRVELTHDEKLARQVLLHKAGGMIFPRFLGHSVKLGCQSLQLK